MQLNEGALSIRQRLALPMPAFFKKVQYAGLVLTAVSGALATLPTGLPGMVGQVSGYLAVAGAMMTAVSQATVSGNALTALTDAAGTPAAEKGAADEPHD